MNLGALGLFSNKTYGVIGGLYCMLSHSFISSGLFILAGTLYNRYQSYYIEKYSGLFESAPNISLFTSIFIFSNISTPLTGNFKGEFLIFSSLTKENVYSLFIVVIYILITASYSLLLLTKILFGGTKV
jgi:NADH-quinone oxidoreductase subunit M